jgi:hypothetical protein
MKFTVEIKKEQLNPDIEDNPAKAIKDELERQFGLEAVQVRRCRPAGALRHDEGESGTDDGCDYELRKGHDFVWVAVDNISIYIRRTHEGAIVDMFARGKEVTSSLATCALMFTEAQEVIDDEEIYSST